jgi:hypothetical protein
MITQITHMVKSPITATTTKECRSDAAAITAQAVGAAPCDINWGRVPGHYSS